VSVVDKAIQPTVPIAPKPVQSLVLAGLLGLLSGAGLALIVERLDGTVRDRRDIERLGLPVVGAIPRLGRRRQDVYRAGDPEVTGGENFRKLRTAIGFAGADRPVHVVMVTSAVAGEGKTTVALNLAATYARGGSATLLVEADLRNPSLHRVFGGDGFPGLAPALLGEVPLQEATLETDVDNLTVLLAGAVPPNPVELLDSGAMAELVGRLRERYEILVLDTPPLLPVADSAALARHADAVIVVARARMTQTKWIAEAGRILDRAGAPLLGVLLNDLRRRNASLDDAGYYERRGVVSAA
jgi:capsular exopolysaccharide synthesis family protein